MWPGLVGSVLPSLIHRPTSDNVHAAVGELGNTCECAESDLILSANPLLPLFTEIDTCLTYKCYKQVRNLKVYMGE